MSSVPAPVLYVTGTFPAPSETFISRELHELVRQELPVVALPLRRGHGDAPGIPRFAVPGHAWRCLHLLRHPRTALRLLAGGRRPAGGTLKNLLFFLTSLPLLTWCATLPAAQRCRRIHAHWASIPGLFAMLLAREWEVPFTFTTHAYDLFTRASCFAAIAGAAERIITVAAYNRAWIAEHYGQAAADKTIVVHNGLPAAYLDTATPEARDENTLLFVGRNVPKKGLDLLQQAVSLLQQAGQLPLPGGIIIAGDGRDHNAIGWQDEAAVTALYTRATLLVAPCRIAADGDRDALPTVILEAMALGLPVISTTVGGIPEIITHGSDGWLVPPDDPSALAVAIAQLLADAPLRAQLGAAARATVRRRFTLSETIRPLLAVLRA